uniref:Olfactory receptor n=1 Tax=Salarias fasciatus TaxID=181472 RepID=A0A672GUA6_SALFA
MGDELNQTYIVLEGFVGVTKYRYLYFVTMFTAYILILSSNVSIVALIVIHRNLHEPMYVFIAGLLMNSILYATVIYPKILVDVLSEKQVIAYSACLFQWFAHYSLGAAEILLLAAMSYDRYVSICNPLRYPVIMRKPNPSVILFSAFLLPVLLVSVPTAMNVNTRLCHFALSEIVCGSMIYKLHCIKSVVLNIYGLAVFGNMIIFCLLFIFFAYTRILTVVHRSGPTVRAKAAQTCFPHLIVLISTSCLSTFEVILYRTEANFPITVRLAMTLQKILYHPLFNPIIYGLKMQEINKHFKSEQTRQPLAQIHTFL